MQDILEKAQTFLYENGYKVRLSLDLLTGDHERFEEDDALWIKGDVKPEGYFTFTVGDFRNVLPKISFHPGKRSRYSNEEWEKHKAQWEEDKRKALIRKKEGHERAEREASKLWDNANPRSSGGAGEYCQRKRIAGVVSRYTTEGGREVDIIPMYRMGEGGAFLFRGVQKILPDGTKLFIKGQEVEGTFCPIIEYAPSDSCDYAIAEGYATSETVARLSRCKTFAAFHAGNLLHVGNALRVAFKPKRLFIFADNDHRTEKKLGENPGLATAKECAKELGAIIIWPTFTAEEEWASDWNDYFLIHGEEATSQEIKRQMDAQSDLADVPAISGGYRPLGKAGSLEGDEVTPGVAEEKRKVKVRKTKATSIVDETEYLHCLGHYESDYYYTSSSNRQIVSISRSGHSDLTLCDLMPEKYWYKKHAKKNDDGAIVGVNWKAAAYSMMEKCRNKGIFSFKKVRGNGAWTENGKLVLHLGNRLFIDGKTVDLSGFKTNYIYKLGESLSDIHPSPLTVEECAPFLSVCELFNWKDRSSVLLFPGFMALTRICGALPWRPHAWLTGPAGSGKSTILERIVANTMGEWGVGVLSSTTEAGIRQNLGCDARPVYFDEAETSNDKSHKRIQNVLELIRQASSETDARIMKGTADGSGFHYKVNSMFLLSSIRVNLAEEADKTRFAIFELNRIEVPNWEIVSPLVDKIDVEFGNRLFSRMVKMFPVLIENKKVFESLIAKQYTQRVGQQFGILLAGYFSLISDGVCSKEEASEIISKISLDKKEAVEKEDDEIECFNHLMNTKITIDDDGKRIEKAIGDIIQVIATGHGMQSIVYQQGLRGYGIDVLQDELLIAYNHPHLVKIFHGSKWTEKLWSGALMRIPHAYKKRHRFSGPNPIWAVWIPLNMKLLSTDKNGERIPF